MTCTLASHPVLLCCNPHYVPPCRDMTNSDMILSFKTNSSYGTVVFHHASSIATGFAGGRITIVTVGKIEAHFLRSLHLEAVQGHLLLGAGMR